MSEGSNQSNERVTAQDESARGVRVEISGDVTDSRVYTAGRDIIIQPDQASVSHWLGRPASLGDYFVGRDVELGVITNAFKEHQVVVILGGAATGKSRLAAEYTHRCQLNGFWTTAGNDLTQTLVGLAPSLGVPMEGGDDDVANGVLRRLNELTQDRGASDATPQLLWMVDDLADLNLVNGLTRNVGSVGLLITTRDARQEYLPGSAAILELEVLDPDPAVELLGSRRRRDSNWNQDDPALRELAEEVGRLPLALEMLAVRLGARRQTPERILDQLRNTITPIKELEVFQETAGASIQRSKGVYATIVGALTELSPEVQERISPLGYTADLPIPDLLLGALTGLESVALNQLIEECSGHSIFAEVDGQVMVHALTIAAIEATNQEGVPSSALSRAHNRLHSIIDQPDLGALRTELAHCHRILERTRRILGAESSDVLGYADNLASGYLAQGWNEKAVDLWEENLSVHERVLGPEHPDTLQNRNNLANGYSSLGRYEEALALNEETLGIFERVLGPEHPATLICRNNLANCYRDLGQYDEAVARHEEILSIYERVLGPEDPATLNSANNLASVYSNLGRYEEAVDLHTKTLRVRERVLGPEHPATLISRSNLANGYSNLGRYDEAVDLHEETFRTRVRVLGPEHLDTLNSSNNLASGYTFLGHYDQALALYEETLRTRERVLGPEHPDTLQSRHNLGYGYSNLGRYEESVDLHEETLRTRKRVLGLEHPDTLHSSNNLASGYNSLGHYEEAVDLHEETFRTRVRVLGPEHPDTLQSSNNVANGYYLLGRYDEAVALHEETLRVRERVLGPEHPDTLGSRNNLANGYSNLGRYEEALALVSIYERVLGREHPVTLGSRNNLAIGHSNLGRYEEAVDLHEETLRLRERVLGPEHPETLQSRHNLANCYRAMGRASEADRLEI